MALSDSAPTQPLEVTLERAEYKGWEAWHIRRGPLELFLVPQVGGRIMGLRWGGQELLFTQPEREGQVLPRELQTGDVQAAKRTLGFPLWGGDKTWLAPQSRWNQRTPFLDLDSGPYIWEIERAEPALVRVAMISPACRETGVRVTRTVTVSASDPSWTVAHGIRNAGTEPVQWGLWDVCMVRRPARVLLPRSASSHYPDGIKTYAEEGDSVAARSSVIELLSRGAARIQCVEPIEFKYGVDADQGWIAATLSGPDGRSLVYRKEMFVDSDGEYAHGCTAEVYNSGAYPYFEMELHGPLERLEPGESFELEERQSIVEEHRAS